MTLAPAAFIRANTRLVSPPCLPEVRLHLADDAIGLWERIEARLGGAARPPPFWAFAWAGGQALARYVLDHPEVVEGHQVLDLASGCGVAAIAAGLSGAAGVTASEIDRLAVAAIELNTRANGVAVPVIGDVLDGDGGGAEVVLAGDVFYQRAMAQRVAAFLGRARRRGAGVLIGDPGRTYLPRAGLVALARYPVPVTRALEDTDVKQTTVWELAMPAGAQCSSGAGSGAVAASAVDSSAGAVRLSAT